MEKGKSQQIRFHYLVKPFYFPCRTGLKAFLLSQFKKKGKSVETINYIFCNDEYLLQINRLYLRHDTYTDIITFELSGKGRPLISDIFISTERVKENAFRFKQPFQTELHRVIFHGALHLTGFTDKDSRGSKEMRTAENTWIQKYLVSRDTVSV